MENISLIIEEWHELLEDLEQHSFGEGVVNETLFKKAVKDAYYYFRGKIQSCQTQSECLFTIEEAMLLSCIYAYSVQIICTESEIDTICEAMQEIADMLYNSITYKWRDVLSEKLINLTNEKNFTCHYDVDKEDLSEVIDFIKLSKTCRYMKVRLF